MYTLPSITLMKNAASELFLLPGKAEGEQAYQLAFGYIRMLAILLRKGVKEGSKARRLSLYLVCARLTLSLSLFRIGVDP